MTRQHIVRSRQCCQAAFEGLLNLGGTALLAQRLLGKTLHDGQGVLYPVIEFVDEEMLAFLRRLFGRYVPHLDDGADSAGLIVADRARSECDRVEMPFLVNEDLLALHVVIFREGSVDRAFLQRKGVPSGRV